MIPIITKNTPSGTLNIRGMASSFSNFLDNQNLNLCKRWTHSLHFTSKGIANKKDKAIISTPCKYMKSWGTFQGKRSWMWRQFSLFAEKRKIFLTSFSAHFCYFSFEHCDLPPIQSGKTQKISRSYSNQLCNHHPSLLTNQSEFAFSDKDHSSQRDQNNQIFDDKSPLKRKFTRFQ